MKFFPEKNYVTICSEKCVFSESDSTSAKTVCKVPEISTTYSDENFQISKVSENLNSGVFFGTSGNPKIAFDGSVTNTLSDTKAPCHIGMEFKEGHVGMLSQIKYFMPTLNDKTVFVGKTKFQGSNDGVTYTDLFTIDENLHEGYNYQYWEDPADQPQYRFYRFYGPSKFGCGFNDIVFTGVETINNNDNTYTCDAKIFVNEAELQTLN